VKVAVIYDSGADHWAPEDIEAVLDSVEAVCDVLVTEGHEVRRVPVALDLAWFAAVRRADVVFNLCEGVGGVSRLEYPVASAIELTGIPCTGTSAWTMTVCHRKPVLNAVLQSHGLPVPRWTIPAPGDDGDQFLLPAIVKPAAEDASIGIEQASVVATPEALADRVRQLSRRHGQVMVQEYVPGREFNVGFVGGTVLPVSEIDFSAMPRGAWPIVSFAAKWHDDSPEYAGTKPVCPAAIDRALTARLVQTATEAWQAVEGHGYGRIDLRLDADGQPWVLEVNPNPDLSLDAGLANMARAAGWSYADLVHHIFEAALKRTSASHTAQQRKSSAA